MPWFMHAEQIVNKIVNSDTNSEGDLLNSRNKDVSVYYSLILINYKYCIYPVKLKRLSGLSSLSG